MSAKDEIWLIGSGGHAKVVLAVFRAMGITAPKVFDNSPERRGTLLLGIPVLGPPPPREEFRAAGALAFIAVGSNAARLKIAAGLAGVPFATAIHPTAVLCPTSRIGAGSLLAPGVIVNPESSIGVHVIINTRAVVEHDCAIGDGAHVAPGAILAGGVSIGEGAMIGAGSVVRPMIRIGEWSTCGVGSAVVRDVAPGATVAGVPAKLLGGRP